LCGGQAGIRRAQRTDADQDLATVDHDQRLPSGRYAPARTA
jgi:hypothetical protein